MNDTTTRTAQDYADEILSMIRRDARQGEVPVNVTSFEELHDYVDANQYFEDAGVPILEDDDDPVRLVNEVANLVDAELDRKRTVLVQLQVEVPVLDERDPDEIGDAIAATLDVGSDNEAMEFLTVSVTSAK